MLKARFTRYFIWLLYAGVAFCLLWLLRYAWLTLVNPNPLEYREGASLLLTDFLLRGENPYALANHPLTHNIYGLIYNLVVLPMAAIFGNTILVHRLVAILGVICSSGLVAWALLNRKVALPYALAGGGLVLAGQLFYTSPLVRPDGLGMLFFMAAVLLPWQRCFSKRSLIISATLSILGFLTKPYFILSAVIIGAYLFLFVSKRKGIIFSLGFATLAVIVGGVVNQISECYFLDTVFNNISQAGKSWSFMGMQSLVFGLIFSPLLIIWLVKAFYSTRSLTILTWPRAWLDLRSADLPLLKISVDLPILFLLCSAAAIFFSMGQHLNTYLTYYFQLLIPPLVLVAFQRLDSTYRRVWLIAPLVLLNFWTLCGIILYPVEPQASQAGWQRLDQLIASSKHILNSPLLAPRMVELGMRPVDSGQTEYYFVTQPYPANPFAPDYARVKARGLEYLAQIEQDVRAKAFDRVMITQGSSPLANPQLIAQYYTRVEEVPITIPQVGQVWVIEVWQPKP